MTLMLLSSISHLPLLVAALLLLPTFLLLIIKRRRSNSSSSNEHLRVPPCPPGLPLIGNLHQLGSLPHRSLRELSNKHGPLMLLNLGLISTLIVSSAEAAQEIMKTHDHIFASRPSSEVAKILLRGSLDVGFSPYGEHWRLRKICVTRLLSAKMVQSFRRVREEVVASMISKISSQSRTTGDAINMSEILNFFTNTIMCKTISSKYFVEEGRTKVICELVEAISELIGQLSVSDFIPALGWLDEVSGLRAKARRVASRWSHVLDEIIEGHADESSKEKEEDNSPDCDFVDVLLTLEGDRSSNKDFPLNREISKAILFDMISAGTDTSLLVLDWGMAELMRNPDLMKKLQDEVRMIVSTETVVKEEDLSQMSYLKAVIKEILRMHLPIPLLIPHESMDDCEVQGYHVPKGTRVIVNAWAIGRDPKYWEAPEEFRPERFLNNPVDYKAPEEFRPERFLNNPVDYKGSDFQFIPFGAGRRICPGLLFAEKTVELALASLVHRFDLELPSGMKREEMDMADSPGFATRRRQSLHLVAKSFTI